MLTEIEKNVKSRKETDRIMWFSMWILLSVASFGIAWFLMTYLLIKRRNGHLSRQEKLETLILNRLRQLSEEKQRHHNSATNLTTNKTPSFFRNAKAWTFSTILILPAFYVFYFLEAGLQKHEEHEYAFLTETVSMAKDLGLNMNLDGYTVTKKFALDSYLVLTVATFGLAALYWLYRIFNDYNKHFKRQWELEDELLRFFESVEGSEAS